jgi:hypothetical protein
MIKDFFSHKIHSSGPEWPEKIAELAAIFGEFDGKLFNRSDFENRLRLISPRSSYIAAASTQNNAPRDVSKFRDEVSAYPAYLGLYYLEKITDGWVVRVSETARRFLLKEEPDVGSFLRVQLPLLQHPNCKGARYERSGAVIQGNVAQTTLSLIQKGIHLSPLRLIAAGIKADSELRNVNMLQGQVSPSEIFGLANSSNINKSAIQNQSLVIEELRKIRSGLIVPPIKFENRFHILNHTEMFIKHEGMICLRDSVNEEDKKLLISRFDAICSITNQFDELDTCNNRNDIEKIINDGSWGRYFDGVKILPAWVIDALSGDKVMQIAETAIPAKNGINISVLNNSAWTYPLRDRISSPLPAQPYNRSTEIADPEVTRIKLQRRNLVHKDLIDKMTEWLKKLDLQPKESDHIDLYAKIPNDGSFIFEMKSGGESLLDQIRKGLSQLYEYRYRYRDIIDDKHISLCLVLTESPLIIPWLTEYLCTDREINICWFNQDNKLEWPIQCAEKMEVFTIGLEDDA